MNRSNCGDEIGGKLVRHSPVPEQDGFVLTVQDVAVLSIVRQTAA